MNHPTKIRVDFTRENEKFFAVFEVTREGSTMTYHLKAEVFNAKGKRIFEKERTGLDYSQVELALTFVFHQAFVKD